jgi:hypothetical protein
MVEKLLAAAVVLGLVGCGQAGAGAASGSRPPAAGSSSPRAIAAPCRIPIEIEHFTYVASPARTSIGRSAGWWYAPGGTYSPDPRSSGRFGPYGEIAWDSAIGAWLPTYPTNISPDGTAYVPFTLGDHVKIVDARSGATLRDIAVGYYDSVVAYTSSSIYLQPIAEHAPFGLAKLDLATGQLTKLSTEIFVWDAADETGAWGHAGDPGVYRLDYSTGKVTKVYQGAENGGRPPTFIGFDGSSGVVLDHGGQMPPSLHLIDSAGRNQDLPYPGALTGASVTSVLRGPTIYALFAINGYNGTLWLMAYDRDLGFQVLIALRYLDTASAPRPSATTISFSDPISLVGPCTPV